MALTERRAEAESGSAGDSVELELLRRRDAWHAINVGEFSLPAKHTERFEDSGGEGVHIQGAGPISSGKTGDPLYFSNWTSIGEGIQAGKGARRRLTMIPQKFSEWCVDSSRYHPTTQGGQRRLRFQLEDEIKRGLFSDPEWRSEMRELADSSDRLEEALERMLSIDSTMDSGNQRLEQSGERGAGSPIWNCLDSRFDHSWIPSRGPNGPGPGWFWIPQGRVCLDIAYLARAEDVRRFSHTARNIRATSPPRNLDRSFVEAARSRGMAQASRFMGKRHQEEWMDEDDLLSGELGQEQDLRRQILRGGRVQSDPNQFGFKGRRVEQGDREQERPGRGRIFNQGRLEPHRNINQQGMSQYNQGENRGDRGAYRSGGSHLLKVYGLVTWLMSNVTDA